MNQLPALLKREFIEERSMMLYVPVALSVILVLLQLLALMSIGSGEAGWVTITTDDDLGESRDILIGPWYQQLLSNLAFMTPAEQAERLDYAYFASSWPLFGVLWFFVFFYLLGTLYADRQDRSILFWKSMPVSDTSTVLAKLLNGLVVIPGIYFVCILFVQISLLITSTLSAGDAPEAARDMLWSPGMVLGRWGSYIGFHLVTIAWCLPFYGWTLMVSAWARSVPFVWAVFVPVTLAAIDSIFVTGELGKFMLRHTLPVGYEDDLPLSFWDHVMRTLTSLELPLALAIGGAFIYLAIRFRGRADEI